MSDTDPPPKAAETGLAAITAALPNLPLAPGVYRMLDAKGEVLYIGKAGSLRKRIATYAQLSRLPERLRRMVFETRAVEVVTTASEAEALLLEANLIKRLKPRFNIVLRDDKSYPWLIITDDHPFPRIAKHRGERRPGITFYGPFASAWAVNQTLTVLQRVFLLRSCSDSVFANRSRPCLLYQIKRCSAPCVGRIEATAYAALVREAKAFLSGAGPTLQQRLAAEMEAAAAALAFERAAQLRDRIRALAHIQSKERVNLAQLGDADAIALYQAAGQSCAQVFFFRGGRNYGNRAFFLSHHKGDQPPEEVMGAVLGQLYNELLPPPLLLLSHLPTEATLMAEALSLRAGYRVRLQCPRRGEKRAAVAHAEANAREALERRLAESTAQAELLAGVAARFALPAPPRRIEIFDNSHIQGSNPYGVMVVAGPEGFLKAAYRKFAIRHAAGQDDLAMLREVLERRFGRALQEDPQRQSENWPDLILIDGGANQLAVASAVMRDLGLADIPLIAIAKGAERDAGREWFHRLNHPPLQLSPRDPVLYYLQRLRDEAHRFAVSAHRRGRSKTLVSSELDEIPGIGPAVKRRLLHHFGSLRAVRQAGLADLETCPGIGRALARRIHSFFHPGATVAEDNGTG